MTNRPSIFTDDKRTEGKEEWSFLAPHNNPVRLCLLNVFRSWIRLANESVKVRERVLTAMEKAGRERRIRIRRIWCGGCSLEAQGRQTRLHGRTAIYCHSTR